MLRAGTGLILGTGAYRGGEEGGWHGKTRQDKAIIKEGADKNDCSRWLDGGGDAAWVYNKTQVCRLWTGGTWTGGWVAANQSGGNLLLRGEIAW